MSKLKELKARVAKLEAVVANKFLSKKDFLKKLRQSGGTWVPTGIKISPEAVNYPGLKHLGL